MPLRVWCSFFLLCLAIASAIAVRADDLPDAATLLARVDTAHGTLPDNVRATVRGTGTNGDVVETTFRFGLDIRRIHAVGSIGTESGTSGGTDWQRTANGLTVANEPDPTPAPGASPTPAAVVTRSSTPDAYVISRLDASGYGTRTFIDPATSHIIRSETIDARGTATTTYQDYATYGKTTVAHRWTVDDTRDASHMSYELREYAIGAATADDVAIPSNRDIVAFPFGVTQVTIPATFDNGKINVHASLAGHPCDFALDTGASAIFITPELAHDVGLKTFNPQRSTVNAGAYEARQAIVPVLRVGQLELHDVVVDVAPMPKGISVKGLLGFDFLAELGVRIDYERQTVTAVRGATFVPPADKNLIALDVRFGTLQPMTSATFDGAPANRIIIDTGGAGTILLFKHFTREHPEVFHHPAPGMGTYIAGVGGFVDVDGWRMQNIRLGPVAFTNFTVYRVESKDSYAVNEDGLIGYDMLRNFTLVLDYPDGRIFLTQNHGGAAGDGL
jgi:hypothetical protein